MFGNRCTFDGLTGRRDFARPIILIDHDVIASTIWRISNCFRDGQASASRRPRQISSANANSPQSPQRWIVKPHGNCLSGGIVVVRMIIFPEGGPKPNGYAGWGQWGLGARHPIYTAANSPRLEMFRLRLADAPFRRAGARRGPADGCELRLARRLIAVEPARQSSPYRRLR
jgi:hypothetical protein